MNKGLGIRLPKLSVKLTIIGGLLVLVIAGLLVWWYIAVSHKPTTTTQPAATQLQKIATVCRDDTVRQASPLMADHNMLELRTLVENIEKQEDYRGDTNCNYILVSFYTNTGDTSRAQRALDDIAYTRGGGSQPSLLFDPAMPSTETLQGAINVQKQLNEQAAEQQKQGAEIYNAVDQVK